MAVRVRDPKRTRRRVLESAYREFYRHGFQGGSLNRVLGAAGITKGAFFHHFPSKRELGYAVIDELLAPAVRHWWIEPLAATDDPVAALVAILRRFRRQIEQEPPEIGFVFNGCPICNYAAEMSPLDAGFRERIEQLYAAWRKAIADALRRGQRAGRVRKEVNPADEAAFLVATLAGLGATGKATQGVRLFQRCLRGAERHVKAMADRPPLRPGRGQL